MLEDLEGIHSALLVAYKAVLLLDGIDLDGMDGFGAVPTGHLPI